MLKLYVSLASLGLAAMAGCAPDPMATPPAAPAASTESVKAQVGVAKQGRSLDNETGVGKMISAPVSAFFAVKERVAFDILVPHALNLFRASEGRFPKSHDEFIEKIIKANQIKLPELPAGMVYRFNTELGELWVDPVNPQGAGGQNPPNNNAAAQNNSNADSPTPNQPATSLPGLPGMRLPGGVKPQ